MLDFCVDFFCKAWQPHKSIKTPAATKISRFFFLCLMMMFQFVSKFVRHRIVRKESVRQQRFHSTLIDKTPNNIICTNDKLELKKKDKNEKEILYKNGKLIKKEANTTGFFPWLFKRLLRGKEE